MKHCIISFFIFIIFLNISVFAEELKLTSPSGIVIDANSGRVLYEKNAYSKRAMASTTKMMTCITAIENSDLSSKVVVGKRPTQIGGSEINLIEGEEFVLKDLLYGMMLPSANDAAIAIAEHVGGGDYDKFIKMMNQTAKKIGANNTHYVNPHGLDTKEHYSTAYDLSLIARYCLKNDVFNSIVGTSQKTITSNKRTISLITTNELLGNYNGADGVKTGYTGNANRCLVGSATRNGFRVISVVLGSDTKNIRTTDSKKLLNYAFDNYKLTDIANLQNFSIDIPIKMHSDKMVHLSDINNEKTLIPLTDEEKSLIKVDYIFPEILEAPIEKGDYVGKVSYSINGNSLFEKEFFSDITIEKLTFKKNLISLFYQLMNIM